MNRLLSTSKAAGAFALSGLIGPVVAGLESAMRGDAPPDFLVYNVVNLLWPTRMLGVYDYSVAALLLLNVLLAAVIGVVAATISEFLHTAAGYLLVAAWTAFVWMYFSGFDLQAGRTLPLMVASLVQLSAWALAAHVQSSKK